jgi:formate/nitrite transporter FocA (FNT family)
MGFSFLMEALLAYYLPKAAWTPLVSKFGYCIGFIMVVLGRQQLFTENTLTPILQLLHRKSRKTLLHVVRLWTTVFCANMGGALVFALLLHALVYFNGDLGTELTPIGLKVYATDFGATLVSALFAGWLIAMMVWLLPFAETGRVAIIIIITYVVGLGGFAHIIAGSVNAFYTLLAGAASFGDFFLRFLIPTLLGNIVGGVAFVAAINHAQVTYDRENAIRGSHP